MTLTHNRIEFERENKLKNHILQNRKIKLGLGGVDNKKKSLFNNTCAVYVR